MPLPDDITANLPPPRDDEPESLRRDIFDELADHLACALDRERQRQSALPADLSGPPDQRVLQRFGNPAQVAMRLWWDAMSEKIMTQRILVGFTAVLTLACCLAVAFSIQMVTRQQQAMAAMTRAMMAEAAAKEQQRLQLEQMLADNRASAEKLVAQAEAGTKLAQQGLTEARAAQQDLMTRLKQLETKAAEPADWNPAEIQLVLGTEDGPPAAGFEVRMTIEADGAGVPPLNGKSDAQGAIRFERVRYGVYTLTCIAPWGERSVRSVSLQPGEAFREKIVCPPQAPEVYSGLVRLELPDDLRDRPLYFSLNLGMAFRRFGDGRWSTRNLPGLRGMGLGGGFGGGFGSGLLLSSHGVIHASDRRPVSLLPDSLDVAEDGKVLGIRYPGLDYVPGSAVSFYTPSDLDPAATEDGIRRQKMLAQIPDADLSADLVKFRRSQEGSLLLLIPEANIASLRAAFVQVDKTRDAGLKRISFGRKGNLGLAEFPPALESIREEPEGGQLGPGGR